MEPCPPPPEAEAVAVEPYCTVAPVAVGAF